MMKSLKVFGILAAVFLLVDSDVRGALWGPWDLNTLVSKSEAIVIAMKVGTRDVTDQTGKTVTLTKYRVQRVCKGAVLPGEELEIRDWYPRKDMFGKPVQVGPDAILFLDKTHPQRDRSLRSFKEADRPRFSITHSGLRLLSGDQVYSYTQVMNPGPIVPTPAGTLREFEANLRTSITLVETFSQLERMENSVERRERVLELLKPYEDAVRSTPQHANVIISRGGDLFLQEAVDLLLESGDVEGALEVFARVTREDFTDTIALDTATALASAESASLSPRLRATAIRTLRWSLFHDLSQLKRILALTSDAETEVQAAAQKKLLWLHRGYRMNKHMHTPDLTEFWEKALAEISKIGGTTERE